MNVDLLTGGWDYTDLPPNVRIGSGCFLERKASFERFRSVNNPGLVLGNRVQVYTWTAFSVEPSGTMSVGDDTILVGAIFMCAESISIGNQVVISYNVTIADCDFHPRDPDLRRQDAIAIGPSGDRRMRPPLVSRPVVVEDNVWIGIGAIILKGTRIGRGARVEPGSVVTKSVPAGGLVRGNPAFLVHEESTDR